MDSDSKRRIRRISIPLFWISEIVLLISLVLGLFAMYYEEELPEAMIGADATQQLVMADEVLMQTAIRLSMQKEENLSRFLPPRDLTDLSEWAAQIKEHMDVECAVFLFDGKVMRWPLLPAQFESRALVVDSVARLPFDEDSTTQTRRLGSFLMRTIPTANGEHARGVLIRPDDSDLCWGVVFRLLDEIWFPFARKLSSSLTYTQDWNIGEFNAVFDMKKRADRPDTVANKSRFGLQLFSQSDSLLFATPGIDTSFHKFQQRHDIMPTYTIVYLPIWKEEFLQMVKTRFQDHLKTSWRTIVFPVILMFVIALFYHWIDKLTRPE